MLIDEVQAFDQDGTVREEVSAAQKELQAFRHKFPFQEKPDSIDALTEEDIYDPGSGHDYFFKWLEYRLRPLGGYNIGSSRVYENVRDRLDEFKGLLRIATDKKLSVADRIDAPWEEIPGLGGDKLIAKKIIASYDDEVLPLFKTSLLERAFVRIIGDERLPEEESSSSVGRRFQFLTSALIEEKARNPYTRDWSLPYFGRFLHALASESGTTPLRTQEPVAPDQLRNYGLLFAPTMHEEVVFLFAKLHERIGYPYILRIQQAFPDVYAIDSNRRSLRIEIETLASQFDHDRNGCDVIVCWENDLDAVQEGGPEIVQLRDFL